MHDFVNYVFSPFTCESCLLCYTYLNWNYLALITNNLIINISRTSLKWVSNVNGKLMVIVAIMVMAPVRQNWGFAKVPVTFANCVQPESVSLGCIWPEGKVRIIIAHFNTQVVFRGPPVLVCDHVLGASIVFELGPNLNLVWEGIWCSIVIARNWKR